MRRAIILAGLALLLASCTTATISAPSAMGITPHPAAGAHDWLQFDFDGQHSGVNPNETQITLHSVSKLHRLWVVKLAAPADSTPVLLGDVALPNSKHGAVLYVTTRAGALIAVDAATGAQLWQAQPAGQHITNSSPVIDPSKQFVYSYGLGGKVHKYQVGNGHEVTGNGWPLTATLMTDVEKESSALTIANGRLYVTTSGYIGDHGHYEGHVVTLPLAGGTPGVWNSLCSDKPELLGPTQGQPNYCSDIQSGIWARAGVTVDPVSGAVYAVSGNGPYNGRTNWGDSVMALSPDLAHLRDVYTPANTDALNSRDQDLGSTAPALLPAISGSKTPLLAVQGGKDGLLRLLNRQNLSGQGAPGHLGGEVATAQGCGLFTQPAVWTDPTGKVWVFVADGCATSGYQVQTDSAGKTTLHQGWRISQTGTSPIIAGGVLFFASNGLILALNPQTGKTVWASDAPQAGGTIGSVHWESPIAINGHIYMSDDDGNLSAYGL